MKIKWDEAAQWVEMAGNPAPANADIGTLRARDGKKLRNGVFSVADARATIVLMTGYSEFIEKYFETIKDLQQAGYCVVLPEWRGHGLSEGNSTTATRLHVSDFDQNVEDLEDRLEKLLAGCPRPVFGLSHSMGGQISLRAAHKHKDWFCALAQSAPMHGLAMPALARMMLLIVAQACALIGKADSAVPSMPPVERPADAASNVVTYDMARFNRNEQLFVKDPRLQLNGVSLGWILAASKAMRASVRPAYLKNFTTPLFIGTAEDEKLVDNASHAHVVAHVQNGQGKTYPHAMHELLMEKDATRQSFLADILAFYQNIQAH